MKELRPDSISEILAAIRFRVLHLTRYKHVKILNIQNYTNDMLFHIGMNPGLLYTDLEFLRTGYRRRRAKKIHVEECRNLSLINIVVLLTTGP